MVTVHLRSAWTSIVPRVNKGADPYQDLASLRDPQKLEVNWLPDYFDYQMAQPEQLLVDLLKTDLNYGGLSDASWNFAVAGNKEGVYVLRGCRTKDAFQLRDREETLSVLCLLGRAEKPTDQLLDNLKAAYSLCNYVYPGIEFGENKQEHLFNLVQAVPVGTEKIVFPKVEQSLYLESESVHVHGLIEALSYYGYYKSRNDARYGPITKQAVAELQYDMKKIGYYHKAIDGYYGRWTRDAFERFKNRLGKGN